MANNISGWITINGKHIPIMAGETHEEAAKRFVAEQKSKIKSSRKAAEKIVTKTENFVDSKGNSIEVKQVSPKKFQKALDDAKASQPTDKSWRVDNTSHSLSDYSKDKLYVTKNGSTIAITPDGDIISVCSKVGGGDSGRSIMEFAIAKGGKKLDSYDGNFGFYTKMGFEPVSYCKFDIKYAPSDWRNGIDKQEPIVFFKYTGSTKPISTIDFYKNTKVSKDYDTAMNLRDKEVK